MTYRNSTRNPALMASLVATALVVPAGATLANQVEGTQLTQHHRGNHLRGANCHFRGKRASERRVRRSARATGFRRIHNIRFVPRRYGRRHSCGYYTADAQRQGRHFVIFADSRTGRIIGRDRIGRRGQSFRPNMSIVQVRTRLRRQGYRRIRNVRYVRRNGRDFYMARAHWRRWVWRLRIDDETGRIVNRQRLRRIGFKLKSPDLSRRQVRSLLRSQGYREIRGVRHQQTADTDFLAIAEFDRVPYRLRVSGTTGQVEAKRRLR